MATDPEISKAVVSILQEVKNAARSMATASEKLSATGLDKFVVEIKKSLKTQSLINDEDLKTIKTAGDLQKILSNLEDQYSTIIKVEKEALKLQEKELKGLQITAEQRESDLKRKIKDSLLEHDISVEHAAAIKAGIAGLRNETDSRLKLIAATDGLNKAYEQHKKKLVESVKSFGSLETAIDLSKKAFFQFYDQMNRLTAKGMLGALKQINTMAFNLSISAADLEEIMTKNRDVINQLGGGLVGMQKFGEELSDIRKDLKYLGAGATAAAARMIEYSKKAGLQKKDGESYSKNIRESNKQMKLFSGAFGDTTDDYANLMEAINNESRNRSILNNLSESEILLHQREQRERIQNLKWMGLNNQQIIEMTSTMNRLVDPRSTDIGGRQSETYSAEAAVAEGMRLLASSTNANDQKILQANKESYKTFLELTALTRAGKSDEAETLKNSERGLEAMKNVSNMLSAIDRDRFGQFDKNFVMTVVKSAGSFFTKTLPAGEQAATAEAQGKKVEAAQRAEAIKQAERLTAATGTAADSLDAMTQLVKKVQAILENPFVLLGAALASSAIAIGTFVYGLGTLTRSALQAAAALRTIGGNSSIPGADAPDGKKGKGPGKGKMLGKFGNILGWATLGLGAYEAWGDVNDNKAAEAAGVISEKESNRKSGESVGGLGGAGAGAAIGAGFGSALFGFGAIPGALIGGAIGYFGGSAAGGAIGGQFGSTSKNPTPPEALTPPTTAPSASTPSKKSKNSNVDDFVAKYSSAAEVAGKKLGVDPKIILSQWGMETGWGKSIIPGTNNLGNIKDFSKSGSGVSAKDNMTGSVDKYRVYSSAESFGEDYASMIQRKWPGAMGATTPQDFALGLKAGQRGGYAEDVKYGSKLAAGVSMIGSMPTSSRPPTPITPPTAATTTAAVSPVQPSPAAAAVTNSNSNTDSAVTELAKQTTLLTQIAQNTGMSPRSVPNKAAYMKDPSVVMSSVHG